MATELVELRDHEEESPDFAHDGARVSFNVGRAKQRAATRTDSNLWRRSLQTCPVKVMKRSLGACYTTIETTGPNRVLSRDYCLFSDNFWLQYMNQSMLLQGLGVSLNLRKPSVYLRGFLIAQLEKMNSRVTFFTQNMVYELMSHKSTQTGKLLF